VHLVGFIIRRRVNYILPSSYFANLSPGVLAFAHLFEILNQTIKLINLHAMIKNII